MINNSKPWIILLGGLANSGKDTIINYLCESHDFKAFDEGKWLRVFYTLFKTQCQDIGKSFNMGTIREYLNVKKVDELLKEYEISRLSINFDRYEIISLAEIFRLYDELIWPKITLKLDYNDSIFPNYTYCGSIVGDRSLKFYFDNFNIFSVNLDCISNEFDFHRQKHKDSRKLLTDPDLKISYRLNSKDYQKTQRVANLIYENFMYHINKDSCKCIDLNLDDT